MRRLATLIALFLGLNSFGSDVEFSGTASTETIGGINIKTYPEAKVKQLDGSFVPVRLSGSGIRRVNVVFVLVNVYHISSYVMYPEKLTLPNAMAGIKESPTRFLKLTMLRALTGQDIRASLEQSLEVNGVDINHPSFLKVMEQIDAMNVEPGQTFIFGATPGKKEERVFFELINKTIAEETKDIAFDFWKIWFNMPIDAPMKELQKQLVGKKPLKPLNDEYDLDVNLQF